MSINNDKALAQLDALRQGFATRLPARIDEIENLWKSIARGRYSADLAANLHRSTHSLKGMGATFGYKRVTDIATALDEQIKKLLSVNLSEQPKIVSR